MKTLIATVVLVAASALTLSGCANPYGGSNQNNNQAANVGVGAGVGAAVGAASGAILGSSSNQ